MTALKDRLAFITGASSGIGAATARAFAREGARVVLAARREAPLRAVADELPGAVALALDVRDDAALARALEEYPADLVLAKSLWPQGRRVISAIDTLARHGVKV